MLKIETVHGAEFHTLKFAAEFGDIEDISVEFYTLNFASEFCILNFLTLNIRFWTLKIYGEKLCIENGNNSEAKKIQTRYFNAKIFSA